MQFQLKTLEKNKELEEDLDEMEKMIDGYLEFARNEREEEMVEASLFKIIQQAAKLSDPNQDKIFITPPTHEMPIFPIQVRSISRTLTNLLDNALKYAGKATISTQLFDDHLEVFIDDNGPGIPEKKERKRYFHLIELKILETDKQVAQV